MTTREIYQNAPSDAAPEVLEAYLKETCGEDEELRAQVIALIEADDRNASEADAETRDFWNAPVENCRAALELGLASGDEQQEPMTSSEENGLPSREGWAGAEKEGDRIGTYKLLQKIGEGGFGAVYMAEQTKPVMRRVALKVIKLGMDTKEVIARFEAERQALAMMDDPNIAKVLDAGATESGRPYFVMELVRGKQIIEFCNEHHLNTRQRLDLFLDVCSAVQHAHQKGVIHRDLKPSNILIALHGDKPVPKVIDFGIAKATHQPLTDKTLFTRMEHFVGTPVYMSPEQTALSGMDIDTRSDIYSLGVLLYELLAGKPPFDSKSLMSGGYDEMRRIIREDDPPMPSIRLSTMAGQERTTMARQHHAEPDKLGKLVRGDLDWIVMKAIEKDRARRYETANALAQDIRRHLRNEPVVAAAPSVGYKIKKFVRRNRSTVAVVATISILLVAGIATSTWLAVVADVAKGDAVKALAVVESQKEQVEDSLRKAEIAEERSRKLLYATDMQLAPFVWENENATGAQLRKLLDAHDPEQNENLRDSDDLRGFEWSYYKNLVDHSARIFAGHHTTVIDSAFSSNGSLVTLDESGQVRRWHLGSNAEDERLRRTLVNGRNAHRRVLSADGRRAALARANRVHVLDTSTGKELWQLESADVPTRRLIFAPAGNRFVVVDDKIRWCDANEGRIVGSHELGSPHCESLALSADGLTLAVVGHNNSRSSTGLGECLSVFRLDPTAGSVVPLVQDVRFGATLSACALSADAQLIAVGAKLSGVLAVFEVATGEELAKHGSAHSSPISAIAFSGIGFGLATADGEGTIKLWEDAREIDGKSKASVALKGHEGGITKIAYSTGGQKLVSSSADRTARVWDLAESGAAGVRALEGQRGRNFLARFSPDGRLVVAADGGSSVRLHDAFTGNLLRELSSGHAHPIFSVAFSPRNGSLLAVGHGGTADGSFIALWDIDDGTELARLPGASTLEGFRTDGPEAVVGALAFSPDGKYLAAGLGHPYYYNPKPAPNPVMVWEVATRQMARRLDGHMNYCRALEFSADGTRLVSGSRDGTARIWLTQTWELAMPPLVNPDQGTAFTQGSARVEDLAISPDGKLLAMASGGGALQLWDFETGEFLEMLVGHSASVNAVAFSDCGRTLASGSTDQTVRIWNVATRRELMQLRSHESDLGEVWALAFSPSGDRLIAGGSKSVIWATRPAGGNDARHRAE